MKYQPVLNINIPKPCSQNWAAMPNTGDGKHCSQCNNIIYDFSQMSDDELLNFFKQKPNTHCGRFHNSQLHRDILPVAKPYRIMLSRFNKVAAAIFTILSFKSISSKAEFKNFKTLASLDSSYELTSISDSGKIIISGIVKDIDNMPLENARVTFDSRQVAVTDKEGKFSFEVAGISSGSHNLYFSYDSLRTVVRNFYPTMLSAKYEIVLGEERLERRSYITGIMAPMLYDLPSISFKVNVSKLSSEQKNLLSTVAIKMKDIPGTNIIIRSYPPTLNSQSIYKLRAENIKKFLVESEGIHADRIIINFENDAGNSNVVDIISN